MQTREDQRRPERQTTRTEKQTQTPTQTEHRKHRHTEIGEECKGGKHQYEIVKEFTKNDGTECKLCYMWTPNLVQTQTGTHRGYKYATSTNLTIYNIHGVDITTHSQRAPATPRST